MILIAMNDEHAFIILIIMLLKAYSVSAIRIYITHNLYKLVI